MNSFSLRRLLFNLWYTFRRPPWDSGITPPELWQFIREKPSGRAIDLGCGTGTNAITLAQNGWHVSGVDFARVAIETARRKARQQNLEISFSVEDVTRLPDVIGPFDLVLDIGCFHGIQPTRRPVYLKTISRILVHGGTWLLYAMGRTEPNSMPGLLEQEIDEISTRFTLQRREDGFDPGGRRASWFWFVRE
ncbi:MAG: SAM-dependent methyltransferase [Chloroflexi bacterium HGW-Chloroflexi-6]|nr:MAG: SAM-dependent methyltransferase [Chloroflexi bacterium HGW-Chloroflexi-6]